MNTEPTVKAAQVALGTEATHTFSVSSEKDPEKSGEFTVRIPDAKDMMRIAVMQHGLREGVPLEELDAVSFNICIQLSTLPVVVVSAPDWWYRKEKNGPKVPAPEELKDLDLLWKIWEGYVAFRDGFPGLGEDTGAGESSEGTGSVASQQDSQ